MAVAVAVPTAPLTKQHPLPVITPSPAAAVAVVGTVVGARAVVEAGPLEVVVVVVLVVAAAVAGTSFSKLRLPNTK